MRVRFARQAVLTFCPPAGPGFVPAGVEAGQVVAGELSADAALTIARSDGSPVAALPAGGWELDDDPAARPVRPRPLRDAPTGPSPVDPAACLFRDPDEAGFWAAIAAAPLDDLPRRVYADWLGDRGEPHARVFRDPRPFATPGGRWRGGWAEAAEAVGYHACDDDRPGWQALGPPDAPARLALALADGTAPPPSAALIPPPPELPRRLAVALREVDVLRRLIRVAEHAAQYRRPPEAARAPADRQEVRDVA